MYNERDISDYLRSRKADYVTSFHFDEASKTLVLEIPLKSVKETAGKGYTSKRQLAHLRRLIREKFDVNVVTAFRQEHQLDSLEAGLDALLVRRFPDYVSGVYISFVTGESAQIWVSLKNETLESYIQQISEQANDYLGAASLSIESIEFILPSAQEPSIAAILRALKTFSPASIDTVLEKLTGRGFYIPNGRWLSRRFDVARKKGLVIREHDGKYILTTAGLELVPRSRSRSSTDVERMLLLSRRKEW